VLRERNGDLGGSLKDYNQAREIARTLGSRTTDRYMLRYYTLYGELREGQ